MYLQFWDKNEWQFFTFSIMTTKLWSSVCNCRKVTNKFEFYLQLETKAYEQYGIEEEIQTLFFMWINFDFQIWIIEFKIPMP